MGKTTLWLAALEQARERGYRVLWARASEAESMMSYGTVADLLGDVDDEMGGRTRGVWHDDRRLCVSVKTVQADLTQIYRKPGIHSRAELGRLTGGSGE